jgi:lipoprotein-anchoring transpeptidase ErfK/SrfK
MSSNLRTAKHAIQVALKELRLGNKQAARSWAQQAVELAPGLEEAWLILASLAEPRASLEYIKNALRVNPGSQAARQSLFEVQQRLEKISKVDTVQTPHPAAPVRIKRNSLSRFGRLRLFPVYGLALFAIVVLGLLGFQSRMVSADTIPPDQQKLIVLQPLNTFTPTATITLTPQSTEPASARPLPTEPASPTPLPTETIPPTALPTETASPTPLPTETSTPSQSPAPTLKAEPFNITPSLPPAANASGEKRIVVHVSEQHLYAYQGEALVHSFVISTGADNSTRMGTFPILDKIPDAYSDPWGFWMPDWLGIYWVGDIENGLHAVPMLPDGKTIWEDALGTPISHGCVVLNPEDARRLYDWADIGTQVEISP